MCSLHCVPQGDRAAFEKISKAGELLLNPDTLEAEVRKMQVKQQREEVKNWNTPQSTVSSVSNRAPNNANEFDLDTVDLKVRCAGCQSVIPLNCHVKDFGLVPIEEDPEKSETNRKYEGIQTCPQCEARFRFIVSNKQIETARMRRKKAYWKK